MTLRSTESQERKFFGQKCERIFYTSEVCQQPTSLLGTGCNAATHLSFHFSAKTKRVHQVSSLSPGAALSVQVPHVSPDFGSFEDGRIVSIRGESSGIGW